MKNILYLIGVLLCANASGQAIDQNRFNETTMNTVLFHGINEYSQDHFNYSVSRTTKGQRFVFRFIKTNNGKMSIDELNFKLNKGISRRYDSKALRKANLVGSVGLVDTISVHEGKTYQEIAEKCITDWINSDNSFFLSWGRIVNTFSYYNRRSQTIILVLEFF